MSPEQVVFGLACAACIVGTVLAVAHRDPRTAAVALMATLLSLAGLYAVLAAPAVAAIAIGVALFATVPFVVHLSVPAARAAEPGGPTVAGAALLIGAALLGLVAAAVALGEVPLNVSLRSSDGYDVGALRDLLAGRAAVATGGALVVLVAAAVAARAAGPDRRPPP